LLLKKNILNLPIHIVISIIGSGYGTTRQESGLMFLKSEKTGRRADKAFRGSKIKKYLNNSSSTIN